MEKETDLPTDDRFVFTLPALLNILFRGRVLIAVVTALGLIAGIGYGIVVKPLYRSSVQIRPGIVSFTDQGGPLRGGIREDIVHFFQSSLYWQDMREEARFADMKAAPIILAQFVPGAIQFMAGGDVITLTNLSTDPGRAVAILESAMVSYSNQSFSDSLSSDVQLTKKGIEVRMRGITYDIELVGAKEEKVTLEITQMQGEMKLIEYERQKLGLDLKVLTEENSRLARAAENTLAEVALARERLVEAEKVLAVALKAERDSVAGSDPDRESDDPVGEVLKQTASREQAGRVGDLLLTVNELSTSIYQGVVLADSLQVQITTNQQEMSRLKLVGELVLAKDESDINQKIGDLEIILNKDLPHERAMLQNDLSGEKVKLEILSPLEQVGRITVSDKPVRPRKMRAATILTMLAFFCSLALVFIREYFRVNRAEITRRRHT
jgi:capsular polysaccharide biosynthesis protein